MTESRIYKRLVVVALMYASAVLVSPASAQQDGAGDKPLTREEFARFLEEYDSFKADVRKLQEENDRLREQLAELKALATAPREVDWRTEFEERAEQQRDAIMRRVRDEFGPTIDSLAPGLTNFTLGGFATANYQDRRNIDSTFSAMLAPIILWKPTDKLLFESEVHLMLGEDETHVDLGYAHMSYLVNDYLTLGAGKFLLPFGTFNERTHPSWINKLPTAPLVTGLVGESGVGAQARGGFPMGSTKLNYSLYYINGPEFLDSESNAGRLGFGRNLDNNNGKTFGARVGFLPIPELEVGYSFLTGRVGDSGGIYRKQDTVMHGIDFAYAREFDALKGRLDLKGEFAWADTDDANFVGPFKPFTFDNKSNGWYVQAAYRPTKVNLKLGDTIELRNCEFVFRYDQLRRAGPKALGVDRDQITLGLDYWIRPNVVMKAAYVFDDAHGGEDRDGFFLQMALGF